MNGQNHRRKQSKSSPFYVVNLAKQLFHAKNISALIYLFLNIALIFGLFYWMDNSVVTGLVAAVVIYGVSAFVALSPVGEWFLRLSQDCRKFDPQRKKDIRILNRLEPLFFEVIERAKRKNPELAIEDDINLYIKDDPDPNAFAIGRRTVCVTTGLLDYSDDQIKAILGHEIGHLATHDTELVLLITVSINDKDVGLNEALTQKYTLDTLRDNNPNYDNPYSGYAVAADYLDDLYTYEGNADLFNRAYFQNRPDDLREHFDSFCGDGFYDKLSENFNIITGNTHELYSDEEIDSVCADIKDMIDEYKLFREIG